MSSSIKMPRPGKFVNGSFQQAPSGGGSIPLISRQGSALPGTAIGTKHAAIVLRENNNEKTKNFPSGGDRGYNHNNWPYSYRSPGERELHKFDWGVPVIGIGDTGDGTIGYKKDTGGDTDTTTFTDDNGDTRELGGITVDDEKVVVEILHGDGPPLEKPDIGTITFDDGPNLVNNDDPVNGPTFVDNTDGTTPSSIWIWDVNYNNAWTEYFSTLNTGSTMKVTITGLAGVGKAGASDWFPTMEGYCRISWEIITGSIDPTYADSQSDPDNRHFGSEFIEDGEECVCNVISDGENINIMTGTYSKGTSYRGSSLITGFEKSRTGGIGITTGTLSLTDRSDPWGTWPANTNIVKDDAGDDIEILAFRMDDWGRFTIQMFHGTQANANKGPLAKGFFDCINIDGIGILKTKDADFIPSDAASVANGWPDFSTWIWNIGGNRATYGWDKVAVVKHAIICG